jgi:GNAT superfamily N-acetyltransferase
MLAHLEQVARDRGRVVVNTEAAWPYDAPADGAGTAPAEFLTRTGFTFGLGDVQRELTLPVDDALLDRLAAEAEPHHAAYTLRSWVGPVPDDIIESWAALVASLMTEAPTGDIAREPESPDVAVFREREQVLEKQGRTKYNTVALDADGSAVAFTDMVTTVHEPGRVHQWGTLVRRSDRGHRLGMAIKVANLRLLQRERQDVHRMTTYNAEVNDHMIGVNELLGFRPVERLGEFQKRLA